jgi:ferredoxin
VSMIVRFQPNNTEIEAEVGESFLTVASRAGIDIPTGCLMGSCHACEVEVEDIGDVCACISAIPPGFETLTIHLFSDPTW